ncbi:MAG: hypothetical protein HY700_11730 [Gemmatimonadetes bacterium]|nr:hypothetical protein [Gemmatimonadota bacterium]
MSALSIASAAPASAQTGLVVVAHGADTGWNNRIRAVMDSVRWTSGPSALAFLMGPENQTAGWDTAMRSVMARGAKAAVVVPLMVSTYGSHVRQIQYYAGARDSLPPELAQHAMHMSEKPSVPVAVTPGLDGSAEMVDAVAARWRSVNDRDRRRPVMLVAHGPNDDDDARHWFQDLERIGAGLKDAGFAGELRSGLLRDDAPKTVRAAAVQQMRDTIQALAARSADSVVIMPILISTGIERSKLPKDFAGLPVRYSGEPLAPLPQIARWIERVAREASIP